MSRPTLPLGSSPAGGCPSRRGRSSWPCAYFPGGIKFCILLTLLYPGKAPWRARKCHPAGPCGTNSLREVIPSRELRADMKNLKMGALQNAKGAQARMEPGWASLGNDLQTATGLLGCSCVLGSKPRHQDAAQVTGECAFSKPERGQVVGDMNKVAVEEGQDSDTSVWAELSGKGGPKYPPRRQQPLEKDWAAGALAWAKGTQQADDDLEEKNSTEEETWSAMERGPIPRDG